MGLITVDPLRPQWGLFGRRQLLIGASLAVLPFASASANAPDAFDVRKFGAKGDGRTLDTVAIQKAIHAAAVVGGTVFFPRGRFLAFSLHLKSHVTLYFGSGAVLVAADPAKHKGKYDAAEPNPHENFQDYGHSYFHNSLIWGEGIEDVAILGPGTIDGEGLTNVSPNAPWTAGIGRDDLEQTPMLKARIAEHYEAVKKMAGLGNKAIALKNCRNITLRDITIFRGGHFGVLATGVDNLTIDNLKIDTNRDGIDIDVVRNCRISNCSVNSPTDDAIVLKSSYALGETRPTENVTITNCFVSGFAVGSLLDATYKREQLKNILPHLTSGRIKLGTESTGGYRNIAVSNCVFDCCNGLAIESVDGAVLEDVTVSNLVMRDCTAAPIFLRLGDRRRAPKGAPMAVLRRVSVSDIDCQFLDKRYCSIISGVPGGLIEDVSLTNIRQLHPGGGTAADAAIKPLENEAGYPDPDMFGVTPAWGFYLRHVRDIALRNIDLRCLAPDARPAIVTEDVAGLRAEGVFASASPGTPMQQILR